MASNLGDTPFPDGFSLSHRLTLTHEEEVKDLWYITHLSARYLFQSEYHWCIVFSEHDKLIFC